MCSRHLPQRGEVDPPKHEVRWRIGWGAFDVSPYAAIALAMLVLWIAPSAQRRSSLHAIAARFSEQRNRRFLCRFRERNLARTRSFDVLRGTRFVTSLVLITEAA
jgi:heme exporter protein D